MSPDAPVTATLKVPSRSALPPRPPDALVGQAATWRDREITWSMMP